MQPRLLSLSVIMGMYIRFSHDCEGHFLTVSDLFFGTSGRVFAHAATIVILLMLAVVTANLFRSRRKKAYLSLAVSVVIFIIHSVMVIGFELNDAGVSADYAAQLLVVAAFILINTGVYQLYNTSKWREGILVTFLFVGAVAIAGVRFYFLLESPETAGQTLAAHPMWMDAYLAFLAVLAQLLVAPFIGQRGKYRIALLLFLLSVLARMGNLFVLEQPIRLLEMAENGLPIIFYMVLFFILFNRVVELFQAVFQTAIKDPLTGLYNRSYFMNRFIDYLGRGMSVSVIFCDIDNFKRLNDTQGHRAGDRVLKKVADILRQETQRTGIAGRYGGEELVALLTDTSLRVEHIAEQIRSRVEQEAGATISVGYSKYRQGATVHQLIEEADRAMYRAKKSGKNRVVGFAD